MLPLPSRVVRVVRSAIWSVVRRRTLLAVLGFTLPAALGITVAARARVVHGRALDITDTFSPASGTHFTSASQSATVNACDDTYDITSMTATLNGSSVPVGDGLLASCPRGSPGSDKGVIDVTLAPGSNDVGVEICNSNGDCTSDDATYYYDVPAMTVTATTHAITYPLPSDTTSIVVYNTAGVSDNVDWSVSCTGGVTCSGSNTFFLAAGTNHTTQVTVSGSSAGTGKITFNAHYDTYPSVSGSDTTHATSTVPIPTVTAPSSPQAENPNTNVTLKFPVTVGAYGLGTYTYTPSCGTFTSCSVSPSSHAFSVAGTDTAYVSFHVPYLAASTDVPVSVTASGPATNSANTTVDVGAIPVSSVFVGFDAPSVNVSQGTTAHATIIYADGSTVPNATATWSSGNSGIATVNSSTGAVTGAGAGSTSITAMVTGGSGSATIPVTTAPGTGLQVTMQRLNAEGSVSRDECLTIAAGDDAAYECGDLRLVHPLPGVTTMNEARAPMLIYNSRHSKPVALVAANVTGFGLASPSSLTATLKVGGYTLTHTYSWNSSCNSATCRIVIPVPADSLSLLTGWYADTLQVSVTSGGTPYTATDYGSVAIVSRTTSPFGAGWWLDGLEHLFTVDATKELWVAGDGNTRLYVSTGADSAYTPQTVVDRPDTLIHTASGTWQRHLRNGAYVAFDASGYHVRTVNREGDTTRFVYSGSVLDSIILPSPSGTKPAYTFSYATNGASMLVLQSVASPGVSGARTTTISRSGNWQLTQMEDPDGTSVYFTWDGNNRIVRRKNRLNDSTTYSYDAAGGVKQVSIDMSRGGESAIVSTFCAAETRTLDSCSGDGTGTTPLLLSNVKTRYDGPRTDSTDVTNFFINRFGAPDTVIDAHSNHTRVHRSLMFPALADSVIDPTGFKQNAVYTARGLLQASTAVAPFGAGNATSHYAYDDVWDQVVAVTAPSGAVSYFNYDPSTGNRLWQQTASGDSTRVHFWFNAHNQVDSVLAPGHGAERIAYDATLGNDSTMTTPKGYPTSTARDAIGEPVTVTSPTDAGLTRFTIQHLLYDIMGRLQADSTVSAAFVITSGPWGAVDSTPSLARVVHDTLDAEGMLRSSTRYTVPEVAPPDGTMHSAFTYDPAHRRRTSAEDFARRDSTWYDPAGNVVRTWSNRGKTITQTYDALNRLLTRTVPGDSVIREYCEACQNNGFPDNRPAIFPYFVTVLPTGVTDTNVVIPLDVDSFTYDAAGRMRSAINHDARVWRSYFANGAVHAERDSLRTYDPADTSGDRWGQHVYSLTYAYDSGGRRVSRADTVAGVSFGTQTYHYNALGMLDSTTGVDGTHHSLSYDAAGRLVRRTSGNASETRSYDWDDHIATRANSHFRDAFTYDARGKMTQAVSDSTYWGVDSSTMAYDGFGALVVDTRVPTVGDATVDAYRTDGFGNVVRHDMNPQLNSGRDATVSAFSAGRMAEATTDTLPGYNSSDPDIKTFTDMYSVFDSVGNQTQANTSVATWQTNSYQTASSGQSWLRNFYNGADQLKMSERQAYFTHSSTIYIRTTQQDYFYDALGRRVALRTRRDSSCTEFDGSQWVDQCTQTMDRFIWDGADLVTELRDYGGWDDLGSINSNGSGGTVQYTNATGVLGQDVPLLVIKNGSSGFVPWATWHGTFEYGTFVDGSDMSGYSWPARTNGLYFSPDERINTQIVPNGWYGSLIDGKADANGLMYDRNRYYNPASGQFTQMDPAGLGGGMNLYGYAGGDPVNSSDPFGLCPPDKPCPAQQLIDAAQRKVDEVVANVSDDLEAIGRVVGLVDRTATSSVDVQMGNVVASLSAGAIGLSLTPDIAISAVFNVGANWGGEGRMSIGGTVGEGVIGGGSVNFAGGKPSGFNLQAGIGWRPSPVDLKLSKLVKIAQTVTVKVGSQTINP